MNHSCAPNCIALFRGSRQFIVACRNIEVGEELTLCYIDNGIEDALLRQNYLKEQYYFNCLCTRCLEDLKTSKKIIGGVEPTNLEEEERKLD